MARHRMHLLLLPLYALLLINTTEAKYVRAHIKGNDFVFLSKFCFTQVPSIPQYAAGTLQWHVYNSISSPSLRLAFYDDEDNQWPSIGQGSLSCEQKFIKSDYNTSLNVQPQEIGPRDVVSPHFWYVVAVDCGNPIDLDYSLTFLNSWGGDGGQAPNEWIKHFSCDEVGLEALYIFYTIFFFVMVVVHGYAAYSLVKVNSYHTIVKLVTICIVLEWLSALCYIIHYAVYQKDGVGAPALRGIAEMLDLMAQLVLMLFLIMVAKGWCISKTKLDDAKVVMTGLGLLTAAYLALFIWQNVGVDPASTKYEYESPPGIIILVLRGIAMIWFIFCLRGTLQQEYHPPKRRFYIWFGALFIAWFLALPLITIIASSLKHQWTELRLVMILYTTANALGLSGLVFLLWPTRASEYFQISARMDLAGTMPYDSI